MSCLLNSRRRHGPKNGIRCLVSRHSRSLPVFSDTSHFFAASQSLAIDLESLVGAVWLGRLWVCPLACSDLQLFVPELLERRGAVHSLAAVADGDVTPVAVGDRDFG